MNIKELKNLLDEFGDSVKFEYDLKKNFSYRSKIKKNYIKNEDINSTTL